MSWTNGGCWQRGGDGLPWQDLQGPVLLPTDFLCGTGEAAETQGAGDRYLRFVGNRGVSLLNDDRGLGASTSRWVFWWNPRVLLVLHQCMRF